jgi:hypothetical protein
MQHNNKKYHKFIIVHFTIFLANVYIILVEWPEPPNGGEAQRLPNSFYL